MTTPTHELLILELAESQSLPSIVQDDDIAPMSAFSELVHANFLSGSPLHSSGTIAGYQSLTLTHLGRQRLAAIRNEQKAKTLPGRLLHIGDKIGWAAAGSVVTLLIQYLFKKLGL